MNWIPVWILCVPTEKVDRHMMGNYEFISGAWAPQERKSQKKSKWYFYKKSWILLSFPALSPRSPTPNHFLAM